MIIKKIIKQEPKDKDTMARIKGKAQVEKKANALRELSIEYVNINEVKPNQYNPNRQNEHDYELLIKSMTEDGFTQPIIVQKQTKEIVDGEHRWKAANQLGMEQIPVVFVDMTPEQMKIATLRHNRARGDEDIELSANVLKDLEELGALDWAQDSLMLDDAEISKLINDIQAPEGLMAEDFSESWEPDIIDDNIGAKIETNQPVERHNLSDTHEASITPQAQERLKERSERIQEAKTREERIQIKKENQNIYKITVIFSDEDADIVKAVIKDNPAERILQLCKQEQAKT